MQLVPRTYTANDRFPKVGSNHDKVVLRNSVHDSRTYWYKIFLMKLLRQWYRISVSVTLKLCSMFWAATQLLLQERVYGDRASIANDTGLPFSLQPKPRTLLVTKKLGDETHINCSLAETRDSQVYYTELEIQSRFVPTRRPENTY